MSEPIIERVEDFALSKSDRPKAEFEKVGIVGCGSTGQKLAIMIAKRGIDVIFIELSEQKIEDAFKEMKEELEYELNHWGVTEGEMKAVLGRINGSLDYQELSDCDMVIEAILSKTRENAKETRKILFKKIEDHVSRNTIIATNSTTVAITELASVLKYKDRCISMHVSLTSPHAKLVEVVKSLYTNDEVCANVQKFSVLLGKKFIRVAESSGLITVRLFAPMINEACDILMESVAKMEVIDFAARNSLNLPLGPFEMADKIGIDKVIRWLENMYEEFGDLRYKASPILKRLARSQHTGRKIGQGFYIYDDYGTKIRPAFSEF
ncbi:MAG: 3-hydroxyacyl-CoA dehydrogenase family protein [Bacteroidales bacterium]|nr:3-hydroxyacyl-CoA dehydrogenase family protein [Bacteroidales bacterium]